ncbi:hypothetical protein [Lysinibacillus xylanilyticus]|uniref:hypothetical protein n=1 Tax=Lysinibacillus xylanilyticus TaxID=582475 RepID=UPI0038255BF1
MCLSKLGVPRIFRYSINWNMEMGMTKHIRTPRERNRSDMTRKRAVVYTRVSTDKEEQKLSLAMQREVY